MHARSLFAGIATSAVAMTALTFAAGAAHAADVVDPDDTTFTATSADLIGVGSDTSQHAVKLIADAYNGTTPAPTVKVATFAATGGGNIPLPTAPIARPNGSGAGKGLLYGSGNNPDVDFARSSSAESTAEVSAGLQSFPFALDTLILAVSGNVPSNAPATITPAQMVKIYDGTYTTWNQIPGNSAGSTATIAPKIPQAGSGTRNFFIAQLTAANGGVAITLGSDVVEVQEHDPAPIQGDANAIAPFSKGRAGLAGTALHVESGAGSFSADRALYNVVRGADVSNTTVQSVFGSDGFACSTAARSLIEAAGFKQLATPAHGGVCGAPTQTASSNFTLNAQVTTTTTLAVTSPAAKSYKLTATVSGGTAPSGTVTFSYNGTAIATGVPLVSGQATFSHAGKPGSVTFTAQFVPDSGSVFEPSQGSGTGFVKTTSAVSETFPASVAFGKFAKGVVSVALSGVTSQATGSVKIYDGATLIKSATLSGGKVTVTLPKLAAGTHHLKAVYAGNGVATGSTKTFTVVQKKKVKHSVHA